MKPHQTPEIPSYLAFDYSRRPEAYEAHFMAQKAAQDAIGPYAKMFQRTIELVKAGMAQELAFYKARQESEAQEAEQWLEGAHG